MDEQRLAELFRDAAGEAPPASFGHDEVVAASRRATVRRRNALVGGTVLGAAVLTIALVAGGRMLQDEASSTAGRDAGRPVGTGAANLGRIQPFDAPRGPQLPVPRAGSAVGEQATCGPVDDQLAAGVTAVLAGHGTAVPGPASGVPGPCPTGSRAASVPVAGGTLDVLVLPLTPAGLPQPEEAVSLPDGWREQAVALDGGRVLVLISIPRVPGQAAPLAGELPELAEELAGRS
ncbi:MAG: hypothetical protein ACRDSP_01880 [Pseudonocardiaceae bacterium]